MPYLLGRGRGEGFPEVCTMNEMSPQTNAEPHPRPSPPPPRGRELRHRIRPEQLERARRLRREMTVPERLLWSRLRGGRADGLKFRRQVPRDGYILDFYCARASLVVELDGDSHVGRKAYDAVRTQVLEAQGLRVIRVANDDVVRDVDAVAEYVLAVAKQTLPRPLPEREGGKK